MAFSQITASGVAIDTLTASDIADDAVGTAELAINVTINTSGNIATTGSGTLSAAGLITANGGLETDNNSKVKQKGAFMQSSTHQTMVLGG